MKLGPSPEKRYEYELCNEKKNLPERVKSRLVIKILTPYHEKASEYDQEMPQSQTTDQPMAPRGRDTEH